jgi:ATP-dependent Clp protease ATP-binding subunit ClpA
MFERFARPARQVVAEAVRVAKAGRAAEVTDEHLLLALVGRHDTTSAGLLSAAGVTAGKVDAAFRAAERKGGLTDAETAALLSELGIDVAEVVATVESALGEKVLVTATEPAPGRVPFGARAKGVLRDALAQAKDLRSRELGDEHLLLAIAAREGVAAELLATHGLSYLDVRARVKRPTP